MTAKELAALLDGREYGHEMTKSEEQRAKESGLVVVFGYSDDNAELRGAIYEEVGCYNGGTILLDADGVFQSDCDPDDCALLRRHMKRCKTITAVWDDGNGFSWTYETAIPHETFAIMDNDLPYCRGIVFALATLRDRKEPL